jgi:hypothetical protein
MFKYTMLAAMAAVTTCAMAQDRWWYDNNRSWVDANGKTHWDIKKAILHEDQYLSGGDQYTFEAMLNRMDGNTEDALISGLFAAQRQAVLVRDQIIASRFPSDTDIVAQTTGNDTVILAEETEISMRPMRMVMVEHTNRDIDYDTAFDILCTDLNATQRNYLARWWDDTSSTRDNNWDACTNERQKDIIVRLLKIDARRADEPIYPSLYMHTKYDWVN